MDFLLQIVLYAHRGPIVAEAAAPVYHWWRSAMEFVTVPRLMTNNSAVLLNILLQ